MNHDITFLTLFLLGFFGGTHCIGMCGGLSSAFALQLPPHINRFWLILLLNTGRISSYTAIGLILGLIGQVGVSPPAALFRLILERYFFLGGKNRENRQTDMAEPEPDTQPAVTHKIHTGLPCCRNIMGLAAVRTGLQRITLRSGKR